MEMFLDIHTHNILTDNTYAVISQSVSFIENENPDNIKKYFSIGIHPWEIHTTNTSVLTKMDQMAALKNIVAIGECGLDKNSVASIKEQDYFFERQVCISEEHKKPLIIHCVAAFNEIIQLRKRLKPTQNWLIHGFRGKPQLAQQLLDAGFYLSFGEKFNPESVIITPVNRLCVETDESTMPINEIYKNIARLKNCRVNEINGGCCFLKFFVC